MSTALRASLRWAAGRVWANMYHPARLRLFLNEETITESALLFLSLRHRAGGLVIRPYSKPVETLTGADWEWCFVANGRAVTMRVQAKRLYPTQRYQALNPRGGQIDTLIRMAGTSHPVYVFYYGALNGSQ